ncbi:hypothetical protein NE865_04314 [Phthorimaea operculella]|nr:hypothetical protein NE865_04314 [Phthorimaea operculella]
MADKKVTPPLGAYPQPQPPQGPFLPAPPHQQPQYGGQYGVAGGSPYGVAFSNAGGGGMGSVPGVAGGMYAPPYEQLSHHQLPLGQQLPVYSPVYPYPPYIPYPVQYYPYYPTAMQPSIQPLRPTIMIPNGFEDGGRLQTLQSLLPPAPPAVPPSPAHLAAIQPHGVLWR